MRRRILPPLGSFASSGSPQLPRINSAGEKKGRIMNPVIQLKKVIPPSAHLVRGAFYLLLMSAGALLASFRPEASAKICHRPLTFAERVAYQRAIEDVYWRHRIWPKERPDPEPSLNAVMTQAQLENKVTDYLRKSQAL